MIAPGTIQFARSPFSATSKAPNTDKSNLPPLIIAKEVALSKYDPPGTIVIGTQPGSTRSGSSLPFSAAGPDPKTPFSA